MRAWNRRDLDRLAQWPGYPFPLEPFNLSFRGKSGEELDGTFKQRDSLPDRVTLTADCGDETAFAYLALAEIDWKNSVTGNMGFRIHPHWCNKGFGAQVLRLSTRWCFEQGFRRIRLDVSAANARAVRCYEKVGFIRTEEFWREDETLRRINTSLERYDFLRPHVRLNTPIPKVRFWWMELTP